MTDKYKRRAEKRRKREKQKWMRGKRWAFWRDYLQRNRYYKAATMKEKDNGSERANRETK